MATAYLADDYSNPMPDASDSASVVVRPFKFTVSTALAVNDTIKLCQIPGRMGIVLLGFMINVPDLDTGTQILLDVGDGASENRFFNNSTAGQAGGILNGLTGQILSTLPRVYQPDGTAARGGDDDLIVTVDTAPSDGNTGVAFTGYILYAQYGVKPSL